MPYALWIILALLAGSVPFGVLIARAKGVNIRDHGSGNIGATNVARVLGFRLGLLCFALDVLKGLLPTLAYALAHNLLARYDLPSPDAWRWLAVVLAPILGHMFSPFVAFRGGKGVATSLGSLLGVFPILTFPTLIAFLIWLAMFRTFRMVGIASCVAGVAVPIGTWVGFFLSGNSASSPPFLLVTGALAGLVLVKHRKNIARTIAGTEPKFAKTPRPPTQ